MNPFPFLASDDRRPFDMNRRVGLLLYGNNVCLWLVGGEARWTKLALGEGEARDAAAFKKWRLRGKMTNIMKKKALISTFNQTLLDLYHR